ncbi:hypothetical protein W97_06428 [Coniosporium apollinis CBS 100218]|uniref:NAD-dependent epimerase/dehydratase domain-containing protein n=1 Tax=Coniosporium apollinis (strain CBS 100218) TaxID=1168221 RepID=R7YZ06_CONA1|nr:uncharacterized protein W97_06428 [Coniosporium apollinis CBS 100218]EON67175.1 hypothetical protein W97_06428 [Coniosporium apollinis CBS 100218]
MSSNNTSILITGAGGFIGQELAAALSSSFPDATLTLTDVFEPPIPPNTNSSNIKSIKSDLTNPDSISSLFSTPYTACYLLHGIMSGGAEANLDLGLKVNLDSHRMILDFLRVNHPGAKVIFPSSTAVYGPDEPGQMMTEKTQPLPQSSYGTEKLMIELLLNDYSRRGLLDGRIVRLPTVIVRPGKPSAAASSFASGIVRESLKGEKNILPVREDLKMWVCSPRTVVKNLVYVMDVPKEKFGTSRVVNLPGQTVTVAEILEALEKVGGKEKRDLVEKKRDEKIETIVESWPTNLDAARARELGMMDDVDLSETVQVFADSLKS